MMNKTQQYFLNRKRNGLWVAASGLLLLAISLVIQFSIDQPPFRPQLIGGIGIYVLVWGISMWVQANKYLRTPQEGQRYLNENMDERATLIRAKAAEKGFWLMTIMVTVLLFWNSFASNGLLPAMSDNGVWYGLAATLIIPFIVFISTYVGAMRD